MKLDAKFYGEIRKAKNGSIVPDDQYVVFLAKDDAFPATLRFYIDECRRLGCSVRQLASAEATYERVCMWRVRNRSSTKKPDVDDGEILLDSTGEPQVPAPLPESDLT